MFTQRIKNEYGAVVDQAIFIVPFCDELQIERKETIKRTRHHFNHENPNGHKSEVMEVEVEEESLPEFVEYPVDFYHNGTARQQGFKPYTFHDDKGGVKMFRFEMDEEYAQLYDRVSGSHQVKLVHLCETHLKKEVIPKHQ